MKRIDPKTQDELLKIMGKHREKLLSYPNVYKVGVGYQYKDGEITGEFAIRVHVHKKERRKDLHSNEVLPKTIEGVPLDVIESAEFPVFNPSWTESQKRHNVRFEPLVGGVSIRPAGIGSGTLGAIVYDSSSLEPLGLTNEHVVGSNIGEDVFQGSSRISENKIGQILRTNTDHDCAVIALDEVRTVSRRIVDTPTGLTGIAKPLLGMQAHKSGASSATTFGIVDEVTEDRVNFVPDPARPITRDNKEGNIIISGDSGSVWVETETGFGIGLTWGRDTIKKGGSSIVRGLGVTMSEAAKQLNFVVEPPNGGVAVTSRSQNSLDLFIRGRDGVLRHRSWKGSWKKWESISGTPNSGLGVSSWSQKRLDVFFLGLDQQIHHRWKEGGDWQIGRSLGGILTSTPSAVSWGDNRIDVFALGRDSAIWHTWWNGQWNEWESIDGAGTSAPSVCTRGIDSLDIFVRGTDNALWQKKWERGWSSWEPVGGTLTSGPAVTSWGPDRIDVFALGIDRALWHTWWNGQWQEWESLGRAWTSTPAAFSRKKNRIDIFTTAHDQRVWHLGWDGADWSDWKPVGGFVEVDPYIAP